jgi:hypothetical protein
LTSSVRCPRGFMRADPAKRTTLRIFNRTIED